MSITYYKEKEGIDKLARLLLNENLTPVIGSGFTAGCKTATDNVPNGDKATELMQSLIQSVDNSLDLSKLDFNKTSEWFYRFVDLEQRNQFFKKYFTKVSINKELYNFINLPWPYIFTLNIDDGIENTGLFKPVLPYKNAIIPKQNNKLLYKIHGDANYEISYNNNGENIVFSSTQYLKFLASPKNTTIINAIQSDYKQKNLLFIGCSLKNELDLKQVYTNVKDEMPTHALRATIKRKKLSANEEIELEEYGINSIVLVNDYHSFYTDFVNVFFRMKACEETDVFPFMNPQIKDISDDHKLTLEFFGNKCIFINGENTFYKSGMHIIRNIINDIEICLKNQVAIIIQGRRFSGKTHLLCEIVERFKTFDIFYFPSDIVFDEDIIKNMIKGKKDSIFIFDSNSLSDCAYQVIVHSIDNLKKNNNKVVLAVNSKDIFLSENLNTEIINLSYKFYESNELSRINESADKYSLIRRQRHDSNIDYLKRIITEQKTSLSIGVNLPDKYTKNEKILLFLLCLKDKIYYSEISSMDISFREVEVLLENMHGIIEKTNVSKGESSHHSTSKLVHNSKYVLLSIMSSFTQEEIVKIITYIISKTSSDKTMKRLGVETVLFDNLNQLFGNNKGAGKIIYAIYDKLQTYLFSDMDYWLQRSKSIYRLTSNDENELMTAYRYAQKAYNDGDNRIQAKAALTLSLICCYLNDIVADEKKIDLKIEAVTYAFIAITSDYFKTPGNIRLTTEFNSTDKRNNSFYKKLVHICDYCFSNGQIDSSIKNKIITIKQALAKVRINHV